jgi:hypothetical protein
MTHLHLRRRLAAFWFLTYAKGARVMMAVRGVGAHVRPMLMLMMMMMMMMMVSLYRRLLIRLAYGRVSLFRHPEDLVLYTLVVPE